MGNNGSCSMPSSCGGGGDKKQGECVSKGVLLAKGAFVGGLVAFLYIMASWMMMPWHMSAMHGFKDEKAVAKVILNNAPQSGVYVIPYIKDPAHQKASVDKPFAFVSVKAEGFDCFKNMKNSMAKEFFLCFLVAGILTCLMQMQGSGCPVLFSMKVGMIVALVHNVPNSIWWHFPSNFTMMNFVDDVLSITLAGIFISKCVLRNGASMCCCPLCACGSKKGSCGKS